MKSFYKIIWCFFSIFLLCKVSFCVAEGMLPETSLVMLDEAVGDSAILLRNTDNQPLLLFSKIKNLPDDDNEHVSVMLTPPVTRVEAGEQQQVRFMLQSNKPLKMQLMKRVIFEGIPQKIGGVGVKVGITIRQNLPLVIHPKGLPENREPWKLLKWSLGDGQLNLENDSPYVVRMAQVVHLKPQGTAVQLGHNYVLPGQKLSFPVADAEAEAVTLYPATLYSYSVGGYDAPLTVKAS